MQPHDTTNNPSGEIPYGYCHCGCGQKTKIAHYNSERDNTVKGQPFVYIAHHHLRRPRIRCTCGICGTTFMALESNIRRGNAKWCSRSCYNKSHKRIPVSDRLWSHVDKSGGPDACWPWTRYRNACGYGVFGNVGGGTVLAHRLAYELTYGHIPPGKELMHSCDQPACCNPLHARPGTHADNMMDMVKKGRSAKKPAGKDNPRSKLTAVQIIVIRERLLSGATNVDMARKYGVSPTTISFIKHGKRWKHI